MAHANGYCLHLNRLWLQEPKIGQILCQFRIDIGELLPLPNWVRRFSASNVDLMVFPEDSPVSLFHIFKWLRLPVL